MRSARFWSTHSMLAGSESAIRDAVSLIISSAALSARAQTRWAGGAVAAGWKEVLPQPAAARHRSTAPRAATRPNLDGEPPPELTELAPVTLLSLGRGLGFVWLHRRLLPVGHQAPRAEGAEPRSCGACDLLFADAQ